MTPFQQELINQAGSQLGVSESTGHNDGEAVESYLRSVGLGKGYAWCMAFVYWCAMKAATILDIPNPLYKTGGVEVEWESDRGERISIPEQGCIFFMKHTSGWHTGIVTGVLPLGKLHTIEGNTNSNGSREGTSVLCKNRNHSDMVGYKRY